MSSLTVDAEEILEKAKWLDLYLSYYNFENTFSDNDDLVNLPPDLDATRDDLVDSTQTPQQLSHGRVAMTVEIMQNVQFFHPLLHERCGDSYIHSGLTSYYYAYTTSSSVRQFHSTALQHTPRYLQKAVFQRFSFDDSCATPWAITSLPKLSLILSVIQQRRG